MKRLVFLVEGETEVVFVNQHIIPYLYELGYKNPMHAQKIITNRRLHKKGGNINYQYLENDINRIIAQGNVIITTFLDFFRLPTDFPGYSANVADIGIIEENIHNKLNNHSDIIPYIQKHEMEALMYSSMDGFEFVVDDDNVLDQLRQIVDKYNNPEDINSGLETAPSKRLLKIFNYDKVVDGGFILEVIGIHSILDKCPRFASWLKKIENKLAEDQKA